MAENSSTTDKATEPDSTPELESTILEPPGPENPHTATRSELSEFFRVLLHAGRPSFDVVRHLFNDDVTNDHVTASPVIFHLTWLMGFVMALVAFSVLPVGPAFQITDLNIGLLFVLGISSLGIYGIFLRGAGSLREAAGFISCATAIALALLGALLLSGSLSMKEIVQAQLDQGQWFIFYVPVSFVIYFFSSMVAADRAALDGPDAGSESVGAQMAKYGILRGAIQALPEYANVAVLAGIGTTVFLGGWLRPLASYHDRFPDTSVELLDVLPAIAAGALALYCFRLAPKQDTRKNRIALFSSAGSCVIAALLLAASLFWRDSVMQGLHGAFWFVAKVGANIYCFHWIRFRFLHSEFDRFMRLQWRILIPTACINLLMAAVAIVTSQNTGLPMRFTTIVSTAATLGVAFWLALHRTPKPSMQAADAE